MGRRSVRSSDPRAPDIGFLCTFLCPVTLLSLVLSLVRSISFVNKFLAEGVAATEPDLRGGTADRIQNPLTSGPIYLY